MGKIVTVTGEMDADQLGFCQCHEHILLREGQSFLVNPALYFDDVPKSLEELSDYRAAGGTSLVDAQPLGCGRMAAELLQLSESSGVHIIASTGFHKLLFYPERHWIFHKSEEDLQEWYTRELLEGMYEDGDDREPVQRTKIRAGQIKTAWDTEGMTPVYQKLFSAAADTAKKTGAPLMVHIENQTDPGELLSFLLKKGVPGNQIIFCHMDRACKDYSLHEEAASAGVFLEYDTIGRFKYHSDEREIEIIRHMWKAGFGRQILLSLDTTRQRLKAYGGSIGLTYLMKKFLPALLQAGLGEKDMEQMTVINPARAFSWK